MKKLILGISLLFAFNVNAAVINFEETTSPRLDVDYQISGTNTHVDTTTGLEWLDFGDYSGNNVTYGFSVDDALASYSSQGFSLASESQVSDLFNMFFPTFTDSGNGTMTIPENATAALIQERNSWLVGFGTDIAVGTAITGGDTITSAGLYIDDDGSVQLAGFKLFIDPTTQTTLYSTDFTVNGLDSTSGYDNLGVFMVRDYVPAVPIPAAVWLFGSGLLGLVAVARRKA